MVFILFVCSSMFFLNDERMMRREMWISNCDRNGSITRLSLKRIEWYCKFQFIGTESQSHQDRENRRNGQAANNSPEIIYTNSALVCVINSAIFRAFSKIRYSFGIVSISIHKSYHKELRTTEIKLRHRVELQATLLVAFCY